MIGWLIASAFNKASITDMDMDPEELEQTGVDDDFYSDVEWIKYLWSLALLFTYWYKNWKYNN